jgi:N-acyl-phosphatidylethanolamine-hydrolysing phospholipase D
MAPGYGFLPVQPLASARSLPPHHRATKGWLGERFDNPWPTWEDRSFADLVRWQGERFRAGIPADGWLSFSRSPTKADFKRAFPAQVPDTAVLASPPKEGTVRALWIGHATVLAQLGNVTALFDPVFAERASPVQFAGPRRVTAPALLPEDPGFPEVDMIFISHNHYDHLCSGSVKRLHARFGKNVIWYVPLGLGIWFHRRGISNVVELDWWGHVVHPRSGVEVIFTPAQHWSLRNPLAPSGGRKASLWGGWALIAGGRRQPTAKFFFAGDTGYCPVYKEIGEKLGPFDLSAIPTGAYSPRWFMRQQHVDPGEAVKIHRDLRSLRSFAIHLATFPLADEAMDEPVALLEREARAAGLAEDEFMTLRVGAHIETAGGKLLNLPMVLRPVLQ